MRYKHSLAGTITKIIMAYHKLIIVLFGVPLVLNMPAVDSPIGDDRYAAPEGDMLFSFYPCLIDFPDAQYNA